MRRVIFILVCWSDFHSHAVLITTRCLTENVMNRLILEQYCYFFLPTQFFVFFMSVAEIWHHVWKEKKKHNLNIWIYFMKHIVWNKGSREKKDISKGYTRHLDMCRRKMNSSKRSEEKDRMSAKEAELHLHRVLHELVTENPFIRTEYNTWQCYCSNTNIVWVSVKGTTLRESPQV